MPLSIKFPETPDVPARAPLFVTPQPVWDPKTVADLASRAGIEGRAEDLGLWQLVRDERATLEIYNASHSLRYGVASGDGEPRFAEAIDADRGRAIAEEWVGAFAPADARFDVHSITEAELLISTREGDEPERFVTALQFNYRFAVGDLPLLGSGGKMQVSVDGEGTITGAYRFWREPRAKSAVRVMPAEQAFERFAASAMFTDLNDDIASAEVSEVSLGYFALPPTEPQSVLLPAYEFRGVVSTEMHPEAGFVSYLPAAAVKPAELKNLGRPVPNPG
jgi:hypothetical protein